MTTDLHQVAAGILTVTIFIMFANVIKREKLHSIDDAHRDDNLEMDSGGKIMLQTLERSWGHGNDPWITNDDIALKPCWNKTAVLGYDMDHPRGFVTFLLTYGPEYHFSQIADALGVARYLKATLILPYIRENSGDTIKFNEIYDEEIFLHSVEGVVSIRHELLADVYDTAVVVKVPTCMNDDFIKRNVVPIFKKRRKIRLAFYFPSRNMRKSKNSEMSESHYLACLGMFTSLKLNKKITGAADLMITQLKTMSHRSRFIAIDFKQKTTRNSPKEIARFLRNLGFTKDTVIYTTGNGNGMKEVFPQTYSKGELGNSERGEVERAIDMYICSRSDVFVPAEGGVFYRSVVGERVSMGKTVVLVPATAPGGSTQARDHLSPYISKKSHVAYSCFCSKDVR